MAVQARMGQFSPTTSLPILSRLAQYSTQEISTALQNIQELYFPPIRPPQPTTRSLPKHILHDTSVPDSGYASSEDEDDDGVLQGHVGGYNHHLPSTAVQVPYPVFDGDEKGNGGTFDIDVLRSDTFEREFCIRWLTSFTSRSDSWVYLLSSSSSSSSSSSLRKENVIPDGDSTEAEQDVRADLVDRAAALLSAFAGEGTSPDDHEPLVRRFSFPVRCVDGRFETETVEVELGDAPLLNEDHTSVGLQSWASSIVLAEKICADPPLFGFPPFLGYEEDENRRRGLRVLELGAGTGLLSIVVAKLLLSIRAGKSKVTLPSEHSPEIIATDYHPSVLDNLRTNIATNFPSSSSSYSSSALSPTTVVQVVSLDWEHPIYTSPPLNTSFDIILAADVIYHANHASWIKGCVETLLRRAGGGGVFWLIIPVRSTGRHEGMGSTVEGVFPFASPLLSNESGQGEVLGIRRKEELGRQEGVGRADESSYVLYEIGWIC